MDILIWALKNNWIKFVWDLPGSPLLWAKLTACFDDKHITDGELTLVLEQLKEEVGTIAQKVIDALIWAIELVSPIDWSIEGTWEKFWKPIVDKVRDGKLTNVEVGNIIGTLVRW
ncbi:unnamed protein product [marine sediment metagenome]|uniref:Uncharacterized protein n=1 Tax=marine sediment metagenome TaxID=412755 RepID=X1NZ56_9ZZZZ